MSHTQVLYLCHTTQIGLCVWVYMFVYVCMCVLRSTCTTLHTYIKRVCAFVYVRVRMRACGCARVCVFVCLLLSNKYHSNRCFGGFFSIIVLIINYLKQQYCFIV